VTAADVDVVTVELDDPTLGGPVDIGTLRRNRVSQGSIVAFAYNPDWLASRTAFAIDRVHTLVSGDQWPRNGATCKTVVHAIDCGPSGLAAAA
jgi:hypothetical protein